MTAIGGAGAQIGLERRELLEACELFVYSTTQATNAILEERTARTALLCTEGFPDILARREGGSMHLYDFRRPFPEPYVPRQLTFEIPERIGAEGEVVVALDVERPPARRSARWRRRRSRRSRSRCCGRSPTPSTRLRLGELIEQELPGRSVHALAPAQPDHARVPPRPRAPRSTPR